MVFQSVDELDHNRVSNKQTNKPPGEIQLFCADIVGNSIGIRNMKGHIMGF